VESLSETEIPQDCGYNKIYQYSWNCAPKHGINLVATQQLAKLCKKRWGWHFVPHQDMDYNRDTWYERQDLVITFENKWDLVHAKLRIDP